MPPAAGQTDVLDYFPPASFTSEYHLGSDAAATNPTYYYLDTQRMYQYLIKGKNGFPADINVVGEDYIYQLVTEGPNGWSDPTSYKQFASKTFPNGKGGIPWLPRYITEGAEPITIVCADSTYQTYGGGKVANTQTLGGPVSITVYGPIIHDFGGDLGQQLALVQDYFWGGSAGNANRERNYYIKGLGHALWSLSTLQNGLYVNTQTPGKDWSLFNRKQLGATPKVNFPNPLP